MTDSLNLQICGAGGEGGRAGCLRSGLAMDFTSLTANHMIHSCSDTTHWF